MIQIDDIIELKTKSEIASISFATRYLVQINFTFDLTVVSDKFSGTSHFCVRRKQIESMCDDLANMYKTLSGTTILKDNDSDSFVAFELASNGNLYLFGQVGGTHEDHFMKFKFATDQTCIPEFVQDFRRLLKYKHDYLHK